LQLRVYVAPCGIGLGHITRCEPIADALVSQGAEVVYSTYSDGLDYARRRGLPTLPTVSIGFKDKEDGTVDFKMTATTSGFSLGVKRFLEQLTAEIRNIKRFKPDVVLSDSRVSSLIAGKLMGVPVALILNQFRVEIVKRPSAKKITPVERLFFLIANIFWLFFRTLLGGIWASSNLMLIPDFPAPYTISASNLAIPKRYKKKVKLIGPIVSDDPKRRSSRGALNGSLFFASRKPLIYAAVSGPKTERTVLAGLLLESLGGFPSEYEVVISRGEPNGSSTPVRDRNLTVYGWIEDQYEVLEASSVVVSRAGHGTIMKAIMLGKPMILIPIPDHTEQYGNAKRASKLGLAEIVPQREVTTERLLDATKKLLRSPPAGMERLNRNTPFTEAIPIAAHEIDALASTRQT
jgi:UDP-N-acetylglucosamine--N-acetylmuramyl-(pentapeptide) pyrophosphoryl-undecaprenol N-acetylglucosamine transferase